MHGPGHILTEDQAWYSTLWVRGAEVAHGHRISYLGMDRERGGEEETKRGREREAEKERQRKRERVERE